MSIRASTTCWRCRELGELLKEQQEEREREIGRRRRNE